MDNVVNLKRGGDAATTHLQWNGESCTCELCQDDSSGDASHDAAPLNCISAREFCGTWRALKCIVFFSFVSPCDPFFKLTLDVNPLNHARIKPNEKALRFSPCFFFPTRSEVGTPSLAQAPLLTPHPHPKKQTKKQTPAPPRAWSVTPT